ncbi:MAG TPA: alpha/beta hydrolase-fold protein [Kribbella sp.]|nr:alpha/beta hydrolase-fold protein [Kribbella sp.]
MTITSPRIDQLYKDVQVNGPGAVEDFWREMTASGTPLVEHLSDDTALVTFLWRGHARTTSAAWGVDVNLGRFPGTDLWYGSQELPTDLRTVYYLCHDGTDAIPTDPDGEGPSHIDVHNAHPFHFPRDPDDPTDRDHWTSLLELPAAPQEPWTSPRPGVPRGTMTEEDLVSAALGEARRVLVYLPAGAPTDGLPSLVIFDGFLSRAVLRIPTTLDNLIAAGKIPPVVALFVNSPDGDRREDELRPARPILDFTTRELMPWARHRWRLSEDRNDCVIAGASRGGLAAAFIALRAPDMFGKVISQSGSFWWPSPQEGEPEWLIREYAKEPRVPLHFYLEVGTRESMPGPGGAPSQVLVNRKMRDTLRDRGYTVEYAEYTGGHDYVNWRRTFADAVIAVLAR